MIDPDALARGMFLLAAFSLSGWLQTRWLPGSALESLRVPLDAGLQLRGRRLFGANKTLRGLVVMVPASGLTCLGLGAALSLAPRAADHLWDLGPGGYALLGLVGGLGFMLGELPNSFVKRQLDVAPGGAPRGRLAATVCFIADRLDSILGLLLAVHLTFGLPAGTWLVVLLAGPVVHWLFNVLLWRRGFKARPA